jgi:hypothetical protein
MAGEMDKQKMANAKRANTREVNAGKRQASPPPKQEQGKRYVPNGILTDPTTGLGNHRINNITGEIIKEDVMRRRAETSRRDAATGVGHRIISPSDLARESMGRLPAAQKQMGRRAAGYTAGPAVKAVKPQLDRNKPYSRTANAEVVGKDGKISTPAGNATRKAAGDQGSRGRAAVRRIQQAGARPTDAFAAELANRRKSANDQVELANSRAVSARLAAQAKYGRDAMQSRRNANAVAAASATKRPSQAVARAKSAVNNAAGAVKAGVRGKIIPFGVGTVIGAGAMNERRKRDVNSAGMQGFNAGKVAGRQTTSTGSKAPIVRPKGQSRGR